MSTSKISLRNLTDYNSINSVGSWFRRRRAALIMELIRASNSRFNKVTILDIGGRQSYWNIFPEKFLEENNVEITLVNYSSELTDEIDHSEQLASNRGRFKHIIADGCDMSQYDSMSYNLVHCNSVIEHVGNWERMSRLSSEIKRLAPAYYVQTPNFWFPIEPHFLTPAFHWLPEPIRIWLIQRVSLGHMSRQKNISDAVNVIESVRLLNSSMFFSLFKEAKYKHEWFMGLPKSLIAYKMP